MNQREKLVNYVYMFGGHWNQVFQAIQQDITPIPHHIKESYITIYDDLYPKSLLQLRYPPWVLFYQGNIQLLKKRKVTIVGAREMSEYGKRCTSLASNILKDQYILVSGLAKGVDACVHECALQYGKTIGVIGSGLDTQYPKCNQYLYHAMQKEHLILTEFPHYVGVRREHFPWRNRILAALGEFVIVTEAKVKSGTMLTVNEALELGKDIYCFPYPFQSESGKGCNQLIQEGANMLYEENQIIELLDS